MRMLLMFAVYSRIQVHFEFICLLFFFFLLSLCLYSIQRSLVPAAPNVISSCLSFSLHRMDWCCARVYITHIIFVYLLFLLLLYSWSACLGQRTTTVAQQNTKATSTRATILRNNQKQSDVYRCMQFDWMAGFSLFDSRARLTINSNIW